MKTISFNTVVEKVEELVIKTNYNLPDDVMEELERAKRKEKSPLALSILGQIIDNAGIASSELKQ